MLLSLGPEITETRALRLDPLDTATQCHDLDLLSSLDRVSEIVGYQYRTYLDEVLAKALHRDSHSLQPTSQPHLAIRFI